MTGRIELGFVLVFFDLKLVALEVIPHSEKKDQPYLRTEVLDLRGRISHHLDAVVVVGHGAGQVGDLDQFVGVLGENGGHLFHLEKGGS